MSGSDMHRGRLRPLQLHCCSSFPRGWGCNGYSATEIRILKGLPDAQKLLALFAVAFEKNWFGRGIPVSTTPPGSWYFGGVDGICRDLSGLEHWRGPGPHDFGRI